MTARTGGRGGAFAALLAACLIWGAAFVVVRRALVDLPVFHLLTARFTLAAVLLLPLAWRDRGRWLDPAGLAVSAALFAGFVLQTYGLRTITPSRSAFLTGLAVLMVPPASWLLRTERPRLGPALGTLAALAGLYVLYLPVTELSPGASAGFGIGDWLTVAGACAFACHLLLVDRAVKRIGPSRLAVVQCAVVALLSAPSLALQPVRPVELGARALIAIAVTGVLATATAFLCQFYAQQHLTATEAALVLTLEPAFAAVFSIAAGAESYAWTLPAGGALILLGMALAELRFPKRQGSAQQGIG
jgi:drug/metabolite transporter (DMT)-like permease